MRKLLFLGLILVAIVLAIPVLAQVEMALLGVGKPMYAQIPSGGIIFVDSGSCPVGYSEDSNISGKTVLGTVSANGDVGTTGGFDNITPAGSVAAPTFSGSGGTVPAQTFTGSSGTVSAQTISWPVGVPTFSGNQGTTSSVSGGTPAGTNGASATSGNCAATNIAAGTGSTTACKGTAPNLTVTAQTFTGSALAGHTHTLTPAGTVAWPAGVPTNGTVSFTPSGTNGTVSFTPQGTNSAPAFSGNSFDNRSAFIKVIGCKKQ